MGLSAFCSRVRSSNPSSAWLRSRREKLYFVRKVIVRSQSKDDRILIYYTRHRNFFRQPACIEEVLIPAGEKADEVWKRPEPRSGCARNNRRAGIAGVTVFPQSFLIWLHHSESVTTADWLTSAVSGLPSFHRKSCQLGKWSPLHRDLRAFSQVGWSVFRIFDG